MRLFAGCLALFLAPWMGLGRWNYHSFRWALMAWCRRTWDGWKCKDCGRTNVLLEVHHVHGLKRQEPWNLVCLCHLCHNQRHNSG